MTLYLADTAATEELATQTCRLLPEETAGWIVLLEGELGAGKSTFARALISAMGHQGPVPSPTYTLVEPYELSGKRIYHIDLYRISSEDELRYLGWSELDDGLRLVEWPDRVRGLTEQADLRIALSFEGAGRSVDIRGLSTRGAELADRLDQSTPVEQED